MTRPTAWERKPLLSWGFGAAFAALYLATLTWDHSVDAVIYAGQAELAADTGRIGLTVFNPAHVLHTASGALLTWLLARAGIYVRSLTLLQTLSAISGGAAVGLVHRLLVRHSGMPRTAAATSLALGLAGGVWAFAVQGEPNLPALALAAGGLLVIAPLLLGEAEGTGRRVAVAGLLLGCAAAFHLTLGTLWIGLAAAAPVAGRETALRVLATLALAGLVLVAAYVPRALLLRDVPEAGALDLITFAGESPYPAYLGRSGFAPVAQLGAVLRAQAPAASGRWWTALAWPARLVPVAWIAGGVAGGVAALRRRDGRGPLLAASSVWFVANLLLFSAWADRNFEFTSFLLVPLACAGCLGAGIAAQAAGETRALRWDRPVATALAAGGAVTAVVVAAGTILPALRPEANPVLAEARLVEASTGRGEPVIVGGGPETRTKVYVPYFAARPVLVPDFFFGPSLETAASLERFEDRLREACGRGRVWALGAIADPAGPARFEGIPYDAVRARIRRYDPTPVARTEGGTILWRLASCGG